MSSTESPATNGHVRPDLAKIDQYVERGLPESMEKVAEWSSIPPVERLRMYTAACNQAIESVSSSPNNRFSDYHRTGMQFGRNGHDDRVESNLEDGNVCRLTVNHYSRLKEQYYQIILKELEEDAKIVKSA